MNDGYILYGLTPEQYHAGVDRLWDALGITTTQDYDVFYLAAMKIKELEQENKALKDELIYWTGKTE